VLQCFAHDDIMSWADPSICDGRTKVASFLAHEVTLFVLIYLGSLDSITYVMLTIFPSYESEKVMQRSRQPLCSVGWSNRRVVCRAAICGVNFCLSHESRLKIDRTSTVRCVLAFTTDSSPHRRSALTELNPARALSLCCASDRPEDVDGLLLSAWRNQA
jgi:hypothetical protein